jgi:tripeptide aminopeptidase
LNGTEVIMGIDRERLVNEFIRLVKIDSPSYKEREAMDYISCVCRELGLEVYEDDAGEKAGGNAGNLIVRMKGRKDVPAVLIMAHVDNVPPCMGIKPVIEGDVIRSDGTTVLGADDKAGAAVMLEILKALTEDGGEHGDVEAVFTIAEETGLVGSQLLDYTKIKAEYGFVLDSNGDAGTYVIKAPYYNSFRAAVYGRAAHAGVEPEKGISAIKIAAEAITQMPFGRIDFETTSNVGYICGGGANNIVADNVLLRGEIRSRNKAMLDEVTGKIAEAFEKSASSMGGRCDFEASAGYSGYSLSKDSKIVSILEKAAAACGINLCPQESGGGSDTNNLNQAGIAAVDMGLGMYNVHSVNEYLDIGGMYRTAEFLMEIIRNVE